MITRATNNEDVSTIIRVRGKNFMNSPTTPPQKASGRNAERVVAVDVIIGHAISPIALLADSNTDNPVQHTDIYCQRPQWHCQQVIPGQELVKIEQSY